MELSERKRKILKAIVESYIETAEPVGSKAISEKGGLGISPATIRNEMAELTALGLLEQPHTSAGRVPSPHGYRIYVNDLMDRHALSMKETREINNALNAKVQQLDLLLSDAGEVLSELTNYPAYAVAAPVVSATIKRFDLIFVDANTVIAVAMMDNSSVKNKLMTFPDGIEEAFVRKLASVFNANFTGITADELTPELISSAEKVTGDEIGAVAAVAGFALNLLHEAGRSRPSVSGVSQILAHPEFKDAQKAQKLMSYLSEGKDIEKMPVPNDGSEIKIVIGPENVAEELRDSSVVMASYDLGNNMKGLIGVVGPTRMDYAKVAAHLSYVVHGLRQLAEGGKLPLMPPDLLPAPSEPDGKE
jgi:heat-inducible transcriptional repressor